MQGSRNVTAQQKLVLDYISSYLSQNGLSPTLRDIAARLGTSNLSTAQYFVDRLVEKGFLKRDPHKSRAITPRTPTRTVSLLGYIAAGKPIEPIENPEPIEIPSSIQIDNGYPHYALKIKGDSMMDMGILNGDVVLIKHQLTANSGDVIVAITEKGATLKVLKRLGNQIMLEPRNKDYPTMLPRQLEIRGKFVGLIRRET